MDESIFIILIVIPFLIHRDKKKSFDMRVAFYLNDSVMCRMTDLTGLSSLIHVNMWFLLQESRQSYFFKQQYSCSLIIEDTRELHYIGLNNLWRHISQSEWAWCFCLYSSDRCTKKTSSTILERGGYLISSQHLEHCWFRLACAEIIANELSHNLSWTQNY